jgi:hypothetical protein
MQFRQDLARKTSWAHVFSGRQLDLGQKRSKMSHRACKLVLAVISSPSEPPLEALWPSPLHGGWVPRVIFLRSQNRS